MMGEMLLTKQLISSDGIIGIQKINCSLEDTDLASGIYLVRVYTNDKIEVRKVYINKN